jgi:hypothetical protein
VTDDEVAELQRRFDELTVAARAVVERGVWNRYEVCCSCGASRTVGNHAPDCPVGALAALLDGAE